MPRPVVFLDFDGVLNTPTRWGQNPPESALEPALVRRVSRFCDRAGACVVVSSTWRIDHSVERLRGFLAAAGFARTERIIDVTPDFCGRLRQDEILAWLEQTSTSSAWVILDDDSLGDRQWEKVDGHMVLVNGDVGLTLADVRKAHAILRARKESGRR